MNLGKSVQKLASEFKVISSLYKPIGICKTDLSSKILGETKCNKIFHIPASAPICILNSNNVYLPYKEKLGFIIKNGTPVQKKIEEPGKIIKIKIKLPVENLENILHLPCSAEKEIEEPITKIISKKAESKHRKSIREIVGKHIISIRKRKMRVHKRKKYMKKHKVELLKKKRERNFKKEYDLQMELKAIIKKCESYSPEGYLNDTLKTAHWKKPVTKVRGILAPQWVIKDYLNKKEEKKKLQQRLEECINSKN